MRIQEIKGKNRPFLVAGYCLASLGLALVVYIVIDYYYFGFNFNREDSVSELSDFIIAFSSIFFTSSSMLFLIYNLNIQREALEIQYEDLQNSKRELEVNNITFKKQQQALSLQQAENTFFNLINFHRNLVTDILNQNTTDFFENCKGVLYNASKNYSESINRHKFKNLQDISFRPDNFIKGVSGLDSIQSFVGSVNEIAHFVETKLADDSFYHNFMCNLLSPDQRFIVGYIFRFRLLKFTPPKNSIYESTYLNTGDIYSDSDKNFPIIDILEPDLNDDFTNKEFDENSHILRVIDIEKGEDLIFTGFRCRFLNNSQIPIQGWNYDCNKSMLKNVSINFVQQIMSHFHSINFNPDVGSELRIDCELYLKFRSRNEDFQVKYPMTFTLTRLDNEMIHQYHLNYEKVVSS